MSILMKGLNGIHVYIYTQKHSKICSIFTTCNIYMFYYRLCNQTSSLRARDRPKIPRIFWPRTLPYPEALGALSPDVNGNRDPL